MKSILKICFIVALSIPGVMAGWLKNLDNAKVQAAKENKFILVNFTGKDWCSFCIRLEKEVFKKNEFKKYANEELILVEIDFPAGKRKDSLTKLQKEYKVTGFPTIVILNPEGKEVARTGYSRKPVNEYIENLKSLIKPHQKVAEPEKKKSSK